MVDFRNVLFKTLGTASAGFLFYGAYKEGQRTKSETSRTDTADFIANKYIDSQMMEKGGELTHKAKDWYFHRIVDSNIIPFIGSVKGFCKGVINSLSENIVPLALTAGTLLSKKTAPFCVLGLGAYALKYFITDVLDVGKPNFF